MKRKDPAEKSIPYSLDNPGGREGGCTGCPPGSWKQKKLGLAPAGPAQLKLEFYWILPETQNPISCMLPPTITLTISLSAQRQLRGDFRDVSKLSPIPALDTILEHSWNHPEVAKTCSKLQIGDDFGKSLKSPPGPKLRGITHLMPGREGGCTGSPIWESWVI